MLLNSSSTRTMDECELISVLSEGSAVVNAYGSIVGDQGANDSIDV